MRGKGVPMGIRGVKGLHGSKPKWAGATKPEVTKQPEVQTSLIPAAPILGSLPWQREIEERIGIKFRNQKLLEQAFVHRSYLNENRGKGFENNERMEFLGDKVFGLALARCLFERLPDAQEGIMTAIFGRMASCQTLSGIAEDLGLARYLLLSKGEKSSIEVNAAARTRILGCTFEALVAAIYLDRGLGMVELFLDNVLFSKLQEIVSSQQYIDPKSCLQEITQRRNNTRPDYRILEESGPEHEKHFVIGAFLEDRCLGKGEGASKLEAETQSAREALKNEFQITLA